MKEMEKPKKIERESNNKQINKKKNELYARKE